MKNLPALGLIDGCFFIDNSTLENLITCPRSMQYGSLLKRRLGAERSALNFGGGLHLALAHRYLKCPDMCANSVTEAEQMDILSRFFELHPTPLGCFRTLSLAQTLIKTYNQTFLVEEWQTMTDQKGIPLVELPFAHELCRIPVSFPIIFSVFHPIAVYDEDLQDWFIEHLEEVVEQSYVTVIYTGRIDLVVHKAGRVYNVDHKTTSMMGDGFFAEQKCSPQHEGYCWALGQSLGTLPAGFIINGIRTRKPLKRDESGFAPRAKKQRADVEADDFQRLEEYITQERIDEWRVNIIHLLKEFFWNYEQDYLPMKRKWCFGKYGPCQFLDVCNVPAESRGMMLASNLFTDNTWSPLDDREKLPEPKKPETILDMENLLTP